jgi:hypothetical protein
MESQNATVSARFEIISASCVAAPLPQIARPAILDHELGLLLIADSNATAVPSEYDVPCRIER